MGTAPEGVVVGLCRATYWGVCGSLGWSWGQASLTAETNSLPACPPCGHLSWTQQTVVQSSLMGIGMWGGMGCGMWGGDCDQLYGTPPALTKLAVKKHNTNTPSHQKVPCQEMVTLEPRHLFSALGP